MYLLLSRGREPLDPRFAARVRAASGQPVELCYHCLVCAGGCPMAGRVEPGPNGVLRLVQLGARRAAVTADLIWFCTTCEAITPWWSTSSRSIPRG
ncbi:MAG: hypothetical protein H5T97_00400 [Firmicutes bacterium]|nr:hypothetical protein [Bacillota bacterium]